MEYKDAPEYVQKYIDHTILIEGGYVNNPDDSGGATKYGITESLAREYGCLGNMEDLPLEKAQDIYAEEFYFKPKLNLIGLEEVQKEVFDSSVNVGSVRAISWLQEVLNAFNNKQQIYSDLKLDGLMGNNTQKALNKYLQHRGREGGQVMLKALNCLQGAFYINLSQKREKDESFVYGWINNRISL